MKRKGHEHRESFSVLFISHAGQKNRQLNISKTAARVILFLLIFLLLVVCAGAGFLGWMLYRGALPGGGQNDLRAQLEAQTQLVQQLEKEKESLNNEMQTLARENEELRQTAEVDREEAGEEKGAEEETGSASDEGIPRRYPSSSTSSLLSNYSEEAPYLSISTHEEGNIIATGSGMVVTVSSDDTYPVIVEVEHDKGYKTRYLCRQDADIKTMEGAQVEAGDTLFTITTDETQLDYQILFEEEAIDPLTVMEAKG
ncbi:MAG: M23 family metallopeptidase [Blautia sp.]|nr:M23 family metallopeptidase [Blautia sp.]MCM1201466.1 M23 family metallopeptidase [Bacteroides fragilis]